MSFNRSWPVLRFAICAVLLLSVATFVTRTFRWRLVNDAAQIDYACFLMDHGMAPYKDLVELNMPGIYMVNWGVMHTLGGGARAWRVFDYSLLALAALAMAWIARPYGWLGGFFAAALFALFHGRDGPAQAGQRDLIISVLLLCGYAFLFHALRREKRWPMFFFGACLVAAAAIKPIVLPFAFVLLAAAAWRLRQLGRPMGDAIALSLAGMLASASAVTLFLASRGSLGAFAWMVEKTLPYYSTLGRQGFADLATRIMSPTMRTLLALALLVAFLRRRWNWESAILLAGIAFGIFSYFAQGKGFPYHRYPMLAFLFLWAGIQFVSALEKQGAARTLAVAGLALGAIFAPIYAAIAVRGQWNEDYNQALTADLQQLGGQQLSGRVQCITTPGDCDTVLYRLHLVQSSGLFYDYLVFGPDSQPAVERARLTVWKDFEKNPPLVFIVGRGFYGERYNDSYNKLTRWPELNNYIDSNYELFDERGFTPAECGYRGYRIYIRKPGTEPGAEPAPVLRAALSLPAR
jgi:hypothetical protein